MTQSITFERWMLVTPDETALDANTDIKQLLSCENAHSLKQENITQSISFE